MFEKVEFYRVDIRILREMGHEVIISGTPRTLDWTADLYFCWWWGHSPLPIFLGGVRRKPVIVTGAFDYSTCRKEIPGTCYLDRPWWQKLVLRASLLLASRNLFISRSEFDEVTSNLSVRNPVYATLAIDTDFYKPDEDVPICSDYFFTVTWTSRANAIRKGLIPTIEAFAKLVETSGHLRLVIAGKNGDYLPKLKELVLRLGIETKVEFVGMISDQEKLQYFRNCLAYVQPTLYEGFGHAIGEALACGARVITSPRGAVPEVAGNFAYWVAPDSPSDILNAMKTAVELPFDLNDAKARHDWISSNFSIANRRVILESILASLVRNK
ncbi:glycosyltransferase [Pseudomonas sp. 10B1]|uniref:glycosyltransferase n=1 Tax=unclassified Pseudomonas TaxID=196821 RepID=UPI002B226363|nr:MULTISPECIES: glycosyltransferase [unclassified Pseudomonas]MEA9994839.1 glycosyltransferase [Pseudomonas sp. AA4]MEB0089479.1 glycosyltransferase [Pseudomonas sp. RTI1]MEB0127215.1 glycosyltransferase [Pseudomonas sp. CCC1.2]MEB0155807.1 glycosyltransferase [Pseudomonas sp. CCC4.3]MEB0219496.1 glycosyltransferase [Pseudomonas sp. AB12(2023)]